MSKKLKPISRAKLGNRLFTWVRSHKAISALLTVTLLVVGIIGYMTYADYAAKFSKEDFDKLTKMASTVLSETGGTDIQTNQSCSYERPTEISPLHLYCSIKLVTYLPYIDDRNAAKVAQRTEQTVNNTFGNILTGFSRFYGTPHNSSDTATISLQPPLPKGQCNFYIQSNRYAENAVDFLPKKSDPNLIAISFECSGESKAEYFPVTYRQG